MLYQTILFIDDDVEDQEIFSLALSKVSDDVNCISVSNAKEALERLTQKNIEPDVIFVDLNMPIMSGQEFLIQVKNNEQLKNIPVIIFSTSSNASTIATAKELGAKEFITKPNRFDALVDLLKPIIN